MVMSLMMSYFVLSIFPLDVLDEIWMELSQFLRTLLLTFPATAYETETKMVRISLEVFRLSKVNRKAMIRN